MRNDSTSSQMHFKGIIDGRVWVKFEKNVNLK